MYITPVFHDDISVLCLHLFNKISHQGVKHKETCLYSCDQSGYAYIYLVLECNGSGDIVKGLGKE